MDSDTPYVNIARVAKTRGLEGEVVVQPADDLLFSIRAGLEVRLVPPPILAPRRTSIEAMQEAGSSLFMCLRGIDTIEYAEDIVGRYLLARRCDLVTLQPSFEGDTSLGREVIDEKYGSLGHITERIETGANDVWVLDGPYGEVLIPIVDEVVIEIPVDDLEPIRTHIMEGLL